MQNSDAVNGLKVSVIIPNYNHAKYLQARIESVLNQTFTRFEVIILDDCSTDDSKVIIGQYRNHPLVSHIIYNTVNSGSTFKQWEKGLQLCKSNLVWIAESDDLMAPKFLEKAVDVFNADDHIGLFQCGSNWIDNVGVIHYTDPQSTGNYKMNGRDVILKNMLHSNSIYNASAVVFDKRKVDLPLSSAITSLWYCGDWLFWVKILEKSDFFFLNENLNSFRRHAQNVSGNAEKDGLFFLEGIGVYSYIKKAYPSAFKTVDYNDKIWASRFSAQHYPVKRTWEFIKKSVHAGGLMPLYIGWFYFKKKPINSSKN